MNVFHLTTFRPEAADPEHFSGEAWTTRLLGVADDPRVNLYRVEFSPRARTAWHTHSGPQLLIIIEGRCRFQKWGEPVQEAEAGDTVSIAPGEKHWHGAAPNGRMVHQAININAATTWLEQVTDAQYGAG